MGIGFCVIVSLPVRYNFQSGPLFAIYFFKPSLLWFSDLLVLLVKAPTKRISM